MESVYRMGQRVQHIPSGHTGSITGIDWNMSPDRSTVLRRTYDIDLDPKFRADSEAVLGRLTGVREQDIRPTSVPVQYYGIPVQASDSLQPSARSARLTPSPQPGLLLGEKVAIGAGVVGGTGLLAYILYLIFRRK